MLVGRKSAWVVFVLCVMLALAWCEVANAKEYVVAKAQITAQITSDGSLFVSEERTYRFSGSYSWASMTLSTNASQPIEGITVTEGGQRYIEDDAQTPGTYQVTSTPKQTDIKWYYEAKDEERTFTIGYRVRNAVNAYSDVAELYWQFIGKEWDVPTKRAVVVVTLPGAAPAGSLRVWGHGPLHGSVHVVDASTARWEVDSLPARTFLEARLTFPPSLVPQVVSRESTAGLPAILAEEEAWAAQANRVRARAKLDGQVAMLTLALVVLGSMLFWNRYARPFPSDFQGDYFREPPTDYPPAVLGILWRGHSTPDDMAATLLDLLRRKHLTAEPQTSAKKRRSRREDFILRRPEEGGKDALSAPERLLMELLFEDIAGWLPTGDPVTIGSIRRYAQKNGSRFRTWHANWTKAAKRAADKHEIFDTTNSAGRGWAGGVAAILAITGFVLIAASGYRLTGASLLVGAVAATLCATLSRRHTPEFRTERLKWRAFRRFLRHFSKIEDAPVYSVTIWEHYLVYAVVLGVAREVIRQLQVLMPELRNDPHYASSWLAIGMSSEGGQSITSLTGSFVSAVQVAMSQSSSGSGSGGGFSSGGGGGGGGGGGSAG